MLIFFQSIILGKGKTAAAFFIPFILLLLFSYLLKFNTPYIMIFLMAVTGLIIALTASRNLSVEETIIYPALLILAVICSYFIYGSFEQNITPWQVVQKFVAESVEEIIRILSSQSTDNEYIDVFKNNKDYIISFFTSIFPAIIVIISIFIVWINLLMGRDILSKRGIVFPRYDVITVWKSPDFLIWIFIISGGLLFIPNEQVNFYSINIFIIACFIYSLQGFAIIGFIFRTKNVPIIFRYLFYFLIAVQQFLMIAIVAAGVFDIWIDFRKYIHKNEASA
jgi:uncharacterized protein YybS (DUF2232 family)